jgi:hypothetical protein
VQRAVKAEEVHDPGSIATVTRCATSSRERGSMSPDLARYFIQAYRNVEPYRKIALSPTL